MQCYWTFSITYCVITVANPEGFMFFCKQITSVFITIFGKKTNVKKRKQQVGDKQTTQTCWLLFVDIFILQKKQLKSNSKRVRYLVDIYLETVSSKSRNIILLLYIWQSLLYNFTWLMKCYILNYYMQYQSQLQFVYEELNIIKIYYWLNYSYQ